MRSPTQCVDTYHCNINTVVRLCLSVCLSVCLCLSVCVSSDKFFMNLNVRRVQCFEI